MLPRQRSGPQASLAGSWIAGQPSGCPATAIPHGRARQSPGRPERSGGPAEQVDGRGRPCAAGRRGPPGAHARRRRAARRQRIGGGSGPARRRAVSPCGGRGGGSPPPAQCSTLSMLAHDTHQCHEPVFACFDLTPRPRPDSRCRPLDRRPVPRPDSSSGSVRLWSQTTSSDNTSSARAHRRQGPSLRSVRFAARGLDPGSARATDGQVSDDASARSRTTAPTPGRRASWIRQRVSLRRNWILGEGTASPAAQHFDHDPNSTPPPSPSARPVPILEPVSHLMKSRTGIRDTYGSGGGGHRASRRTREDPRRATTAIRAAREPAHHDSRNRTGWLITTVGSDEPADPMCVHWGWQGDAALPSTPRRRPRPAGVPGGGSARRRPRELRRRGGAATARPSS